MAAPRVVIREVQSGPSVVVGVGTTIAGFVGLADQGPIGQAKLVTSFQEYEQVFGGFRSDSFLSHAVLGFFQNGGSAAYVVRTGHYSNIASDQIDATDNVKASTTLLDRADSPNNTLTIEALSEGSYGNDLAVEISRASNEVSSFSKVFSSDAGVYLDNTAAARSAALFKAFSADGGVFTDNTAASNTAGGGAAFDLFAAAPQVDDAFYFGSKPKTFTKAYFDISTPATVAGTAQLEYWNGSSWQSLTPSTDQVTDSGITFGAAAAQNLEVDFTEPADWQKTSVNSTLAYWLRYRVTTAYTGNAPQITRLSLNEDKPFGAFTEVASNTAEVAAATALDDIMYLGANLQFNYANLSLLTEGDATGELTWEYWNGQAWSPLQNISETTTNAQHMRASGIVGWTMPSNWARTSVNNSSSLYYVRARVSTNYASDYPSLDHVLPASDLFKLSVKDSGLTVEEFDNIQLSNSALANYAETAISTGSTFVTATVLANAETAPNNRPAEAVAQSLSGGVYNTSNVTDVDYLGNLAANNGLEALPDEVTMVLVPGVKTEIVYNGMLSHCERRQDRMAILEAQGDQSADSPQELVEFIRDEAALNSSYGAVYDYWIITANPITGARLTTPPSGHIAGMYARVDESRGVHKAPAGITDGRLFGALGVVKDTSQEERNLLYDNKINPIRDQAGVGVHVDGTITLAPLGTDFDRVGTRRLFIFVEESLQDAFQLFKHEPIDSDLFSRMRSTANAFLLDQFRKGRLRGSRPTEAFFVTVDESNNPPSSQAKRQVNVQIGLAVKQPAEFIIMEFSVDKRALQAELVSAGLQ